MRFTWMLLGVTALAAAEPCTVSVRMTNLAVASPVVLFQARSTARALFAGIGVTLEWLGGTVRETAQACWPPIEIRLEAGNPGADRPESMAYAMPYLESGARVHVFVGRVASMVPANRMGILLGHVLAHEITHVLQGVSRHSDRGVMKARWDSSDFRAGLPQELERIVARCLRKDPGRRFQHMDDLRVALEEVKEESESGRLALGAVVVAPAGGPRHAPRMVGLVAALAVAGLGAALLWRFTGLAGNRLLPGAVDTVQVTTTPGLAIGASFSPDGKRIAFSSNRSGWFEIYVRPLGPSGAEQQVTTDGQQNTDPAWSPDGKWIAYHSVARHGIWLTPVDGGAPRQVTEFGSSPAWSPDGRQFAFRSYEPSSLAASDWPGDGDSTIWTVAADGSQLRQITTPRNPAGQHADPSWSPDGKRIVFATLGIITIGFRGAVWTADVASGALQPAVQGQIWAAANPVFAPDGNGIYFAGRPRFDGASGVYYVPLTGTRKPVEICRTKQAVPSRIAVSRDGKSLAFTRMVNVSQIWITAAGGGEARPLYQDSVVRARVPIFSPDGKRMTFQVQPDDSSVGIWIMDADGARPKAFAPEAGNSNGASWNSDGTALLLNLFSSGVQRSVRFGLTDGSRQTLWETNEPVARTHMTPDEQELIYDSGRPRNVWKLRIRGAQAKQLTFDRERAWFPEISWDGQWIVYQVGRGDSSQIAVMDRNGGQQRILTPEPGKRFSHSFASDNRRIAYASFEGGVWNLYWIDRITRERKQITHHTAYGSFVRSPAWRPGTEQMAYEYSEVKGNIELLAVGR